MNYLLGAELNGNRLNISAFRKGRRVNELIKLDSLLLANDESETLSQLISWKENNLPNSNSVKVVLALSESVLHLKELEMPKLQPHQMTEAVYWEIPAISPISQTEAVFDWKLLGEEKNAMKVLVIVGKSSYVENIISTFSKAGMEILAIEPSAASLKRAISENLNNISLVCIAQESGIDYLVLQGSLPVFTASGAGRGASGKVLSINTDTDLSERISAGAKKVIDYWESKEGNKIEQIVLAGDLIYKYFSSSQDTGLSVHLPVRIAGFKKQSGVVTKNYKEFDLARYLIAIGAGVRHLQKDVFDGINLFPTVEKKKIEALRKQKRTASYFSGFAYANLILLILIGVSIFTFNLWWFSLEKQLNELNTHFSQHPANKLMRDVNTANQIVDNAIDLVNNQEDAGQKLKSISLMMPQTLKLSSISMSNDKLRTWDIEGTGDRDSILAYYENISINSKAKELSMPYSNLDKAGENKFLISITW